MSSPHPSNPSASPASGLGMPEASTSSMPSTVSPSPNISTSASPALGLPGGSASVSSGNGTGAATGTGTGTSSTGTGTGTGSTTTTTSATPASLAALEAYKKKDASKVVVRFKAIGNAPIMKNNYFRITAFNRFQAVIQFLRKELNWKGSDALFLYINSSFAPAPDDTVGNLYRCFGTEGHLIVNYSTQAAWG